MSWNQKIIDKYGNKIIYWLCLPLCVIVIVIELKACFAAYNNDNNTIANSFSAIAIIIGLWTYIVSKYEQETRERKLTTHTLKQEKCRDIISKIEQVNNKICDFDKRLHDISKEHELIISQSESDNDTEYSVCKVKVAELIYDIDFLCNNYINMLIPTYFESNYDKLKDLKNKIKSSLQQVYDELQSYHSYLTISTSTQDNNVCTHRSSPPTMPIILFDEIHKINSEFHQKLYTADSYITFQSEDTDNG